MGDKPYTRTYKRRQYTDEELKNIAAMAACGNSIETIAAMLDRSYGSFLADYKKNPKLKAAFDKGKNTGIVSVSQKLYQKATHKDASPDLMIRWLEYRDRKVWKRTMNHEMTGADGGAIVVGEETKAERDTRKKRVIADLKAIAELGDDEPEIQS